MEGFGSSSDYLQAIINSFEDELMVIDQDYRMVEANQVLLSRYGKRRQEATGQLCYEAAHGLPELCHPPRHECPLKKERADLINGTLNI